MASSEPTLPAMLFVSSATGSPDCCCRLLLPEDQKGPVRRSEPAFDLGGAEGIRTPDPLHTVELPIIDQRGSLSPKREVNRHFRTPSSAAYGPASAGDGSPLGSHELRQLQPGWDRAGVLYRFVADMRPEDEEILGNLLAEASGPGRAEKHERSRDSVPGKE
jgi:hypothetical protein